VTILEAIDDGLFGDRLRNSSWAAWRVALAAIFGLPLHGSDLATYRRCTGRQAPPRDRASEAWLICGRRAGKSFVMALCAVYLAAFKDWSPCLGPGEVATVMLIARDRRQARVLLRFVNGLFASTPMLAAMVVGSTIEGVELSNRTVVEVHTASFGAVRGYTVVTALCDEIAFWPTDEGSANPDGEVLNAIRPAMATIPGSMLLCASTPYSRRGELGQAHQRHFGREGDPVLVWRAPTGVMNPTVPPRLIAEAIERDPAWAAAEYGSEFRSDLEAFVDRAVVERLVDLGVVERLPVAGLSYRAFTDPSGGSGGDSFTLAIGHREGDQVVIDAIRERRPPYSPSEVVVEFSALLRSYGLGSVQGDRYAGSWPSEAFGKNRISYHQKRPVSGRVTSVELCSGPIARPSQAGCTVV
jgi:hypothetical protein